MLPRVSKRLIRKRLEFCNYSRECPFDLLQLVFETCKIAGTKFLEFILTERDLELLRKGGSIEKVQHGVRIYVVASHDAQTPPVVGRFR